MKKTLLTLVVACACWSMSLAAKPASKLASTDYLTVCKAIDPTQLTHPYLAFGPQEIEKMKQVIATDPAAQKIMDVVNAKGRKYMLSIPDNEPKFKGNPLNARYVGTWDFGIYMGFYKDAAYTLAFLYQINGDPAYAQKAFYFAEKVCNIEQWVEGAHYFDNIYRRVWPYGAKDDQVVFSYDITTGHTAADMAYIYDWLYNGLSKTQRDKIRNALLEKAVLNVRGNYEYHWWAEAYKCNWSGICHSGAGLASLALLKEDPQLVDVVARSCEGVDGMISHIGVDGGWQEGRGYWSFGMGLSVHFMDAIQRMTNNKINLFEKPGVKNTTADFALFGLSGGFCDSDQKGGPVGSYELLTKMIAETKNTTAMYYLENVLAPDPNRVGSFWELIWPKPDVKAVKPADASKWFRDIDWAFMRKDFGPDYLQVATKAGMANDPHHGHLDVGAFSIAWKDEVVVGEFAPGYYDLYVFDENRFDYLNVQSKGHNLVMVNGEEQLMAKHKDQPWKEGIGGKILDFQSNPVFASTLIDATGAYAQTDLKDWKRWIILDKENSITLLVDEVMCTKGDSVEVNFFPMIEAQVVSNSMVKLNGKAVHMEMQPLYEGAYTLKADRRAHHRVSDTDFCTWIPLFSTQFQAPQSKNIVGSVFYPSELGEQANFKLDKSGVNPVLSYTVSGKKYSFEIKPNGVTLQ